MRLPKPPFSLPRISQCLPDLPKAKRTMAGSRGSRKKLLDSWTPTAALVNHIPEGNLQSENPQFSWVTHLLLTLGKASLCFRSSWKGNFLLAP